MNEINKKFKRFEETIDIDSCWREVMRFSNKRLSKMLKRMKKDNELNGQNDNREVAGASN